MKSIVSLFFVTLLFYVMPTSAHDVKVDNAGFCQKAQTTADLVACSTTHLKAENSYLKSLYDQLADLYKDEAERLEALNKHQIEWIAFRDQTCAFEAQLYEGGSLWRVQEVSCKARMTSNRSKHLMTLLITLDEHEIPSFSSPPRWVNVLINDYKDTFWAFTDQKMLDTDCDGVDELIVSGLTESETGNYERVTVIADSDKTGRPMIHSLDFGKESCTVLPEMTVTPVPVEKPTDEDVTAQCLQRTTLKTDSCGAFTLSLDIENNSYTVTPLDQKEEK